MFLIYTDRMFIEHSFGRVTEKVSEEQTEREKWRAVNFFSSKLTQFGEQNLAGGEEMFNFDFSKSS